ncbi:Odorant receptor 61 [Frankliniella occidentalis]|nr:Odorant receptor 61 [Frankliniella occidentalis]
MAFCTMCCVSAYYALLAFILGIHIACANLYKELGKQFQIDSGVAETTQLAMLHANLKETVQLLDEMLGWLYPHFLFAGTAMPLLCSAKVIISKGQTDSFALGTVPLILLVFITQCLVGQSLEDASRALPDSCYFGPWLQETSPKRKGRLLIMLLAHSHAVLRVRAFGKLNRPTCVNILKSWFSYLQVLLKFGS